MIDTPQITQSDAQLIAYIPLVIPREEIMNVMGPGIGEVMSTVAAQGITPSGPWFTHHHRIDSEGWDFEICVPVPTPVTPVGRVKPGEMPSIRVARTVYRGPYEGLADAWGEFETWIAANGYQGRADLWEQYVVGPESSSNPEDWQTVLNRPLVD